jgi:hypothetical protein
MFVLGHIFLHAKLRVQGEREEYVHKNRSYQK